MNGTQCKKKCCSTLVHTGIVIKKIQTFSNGNSKSELTTPSSTKGFT